MHVVAFVPLGTKLKPTHIQSTKESKKTYSFTNPEQLTVAHLKS